MIRFLLNSNIFCVLCARSYLLLSGKFNFISGSPNSNPFKEFSYVLIGINPLYDVLFHTSDDTLTYVNAIIMYNNIYM